MLSTVNYVPSFHFSVYYIPRIDRSVSSPSQKALIMLVEIAVNEIIHKNRRHIPAIRASACQFGCIVHDVAHIDDILNTTSAISSLDHQGPTDRHANAYPQFPFVAAHSHFVVQDLDKRVGSIGKTKDVIDIRFAGRVVDAPKQSPTMLISRASRSLLNIATISEMKAR